MRMKTKVHIFSCITQLLDEYEIDIMINLCNHMVRISLSLIYIIRGYIVGD